MLPSYPEDYRVELTVPFQDRDGTPITPTRFTATLLDEQGDLVTDFGDLPIQAGDTQRQVTILPVFNAIEAGSAFAARRLEVEMETSDGSVYRISHSYIIEAEQTLVPVGNTFLTLEGAEIQALQHVNASGWASADDVRRRAALVEAFRRIIAFPMTYAFLDDEGRPDPLKTYNINRLMWNEITADAFRQMPSHFTRALRRAQFLEANELLLGDQVLSRHRAGIISETIGESSVRLSEGFIDWGLGADTRQALSGYLVTTFKLARG